MNIQAHLDAAGVGCTAAQAEQLAAYAADVLRFNDKLNLIARTDVQHVVERHIVHSAVLARTPFPTGAQVVDWGTGGGFPLVPLAILRPEATYTGVDAVEKKVLAVRAMARSLGLKNVTTWHGRAEQFAPLRTHSISRATAPLETLWKWHLGDSYGASSVSGNDEVERGEWPAGLICLKGGDLADEIAALTSRFPKLRVDVQPVGLADPYFADKHVVTVTAPDGSD